MSEWNTHHIRDIAKPGRENFIDGDWIEAPFITDEGIRLIQTGNIGIGAFINKNKKYISEESFNLLLCKEVLPGDVLICRLAEPVGRACIVPNLNERNITSVDVVIFRIDEDRFSKEFVVQKINTQEFLDKCLEVSAGTTRTRISRTNLGKLELKAPGLRQQQKISKILITVDNLIEKTEALIEKYQAIKQGMMHDLFTRGIDTNGQLRPSHHDAPDLYKQTELGWIPREWVVFPMSEVVEKIADRDHFTPVYVECGYGVPIISPKDFNHLDKIEFSKCKYIDRIAHEKNRKKTDINSGDIVFTRIGAGLGKACLVTDNMPEFSILHSAAMIRPNGEKITQYFLLYHLKHNFLQKQIAVEVQSIGVPDLGLDKINKFKIVLPSIDEQTIISEKLLAIDTQIETQYIYLRKTQLQKMGLMQDLLTGKVRV